MNRRERRRQAKEARGASKGDKATDHGFRGEQLAAEGKTEEAIQAFRWATSIDPHFAAAHHNLGVLLRRQGRLDEAVESYLRATAIQPDFADAHYNLGNALQELGRLEDAIACFHKALAIKPDFSEAQYNLGNALKELGRLEDAVSSYQKILAGNSGFAEVHHNLGNAQQKLGNLDEAVAGYKQTLVLKPDFAEAHYNLGNAFQELGRLEDAVACYQKTLAINPEFVEAHLNRGNAHQELGNLDEAIAGYLKALVLKPDYAEAHYNLGNARGKQDDFEAAINCYQRAIGTDPDHVYAHTSMGNALSELGRREEALACHRRAVEIDPAGAEAQNSLGNVLLNLGRLDDAVAGYHKALSLKPDYAEAFNNLGNAYLGMGESDEARKCFASLLELDGERLRATIKSLLCFPAINQSTAEIHQQREALANTLDSIRANGETLKNPFRDIGLTNFFLAYHDLNDRPLQRAIADMYLRVAPTLNWRTPAKAPVSHPRIRIGFLCAYLNNHTIGKLNRGLIENLDRERFEVVVFRFPHKQDELSAIIEQSADHVVPIHKNLETARRRIAAEDLDILFYPEIGMDPFTYFLAFSRLAPVQAVSWGHPDTTGIPNIDYFLSCRDMEPPGADDHYSEKLVRLRYLPVFSYPVSIPESLPGRAHFGLPEDARLYVIVQTLFKFHPDFDGVLGAILEADPDGRLVLISGNTSHWDQALRRRFKASFPKQADRVVFVPRMDGHDFLGLLGVADALLDTPHFGGGITSFEAFSAGIPIVSWPMSFMRGRVTFAQYQAMGIKELVADDAQSYVDLALRLARDLPFREEMKKRITANSHHLFERHEAVRDMENFFIAAVKASRNNSQLEDW